MKNHDTLKDIIAQLQADYEDLEIQPTVKLVDTPKGGRMVRAFDVKNLKAGYELELFITI